LWKEVWLEFFQRIFPNWMRVAFLFLVRKCDIVDESKHIFKKMFWVFWSFCVNKGGSWVLCEVMYGSPQKC
jgi:hypothetical protein